MFCTNCGKEIQPGERFCMNCGMPVMTAVNPKPKPAPDPRDETGQTSEKTPEKKKKVSWYKFLPSPEMLPFTEVFFGHIVEEMVTGQDGAYYWVYTVPETTYFYRMADDCLSVRELSPDERKWAGIADPSDKEMWKRLIREDIRSRIRNEPMNEVFDRSPYVNHYHYIRVKSVKPDPEKNRIRLQSGNSVDVYVRSAYFEFVRGYFTARV